MVVDSVADLPEAAMLAAALAEARTLAAADFLQAQPWETARDFLSARGQPLVGQ